MSAPLPAHPEVVLNLAMAIVAASSAPLLLLDSHMTVIAASASFCRAFQIDPAEITGHSLAMIGSGEWDQPKLASLLRATVSGSINVEAYELDLPRDGQAPRRIVVNAHRLKYDGGASTRLLVSVTDVTEARLSERLKDDLLREKSVLMQELQHRVANSLQIIASVLMQSARRVQSEETRGHLHAAHHRVLSVATVQRHLAVSTSEQVELRRYLTELCDSLSASMIADHEQISLGVRSEESLTSPEVSVSLGLIVTELVINALKHAFPDNRVGGIVVDYDAWPTGWTLCVRDDGVGFPSAKGAAQAGLGTSIVNALAKQLEATVSVVASYPGTEVCIAHHMAAIPATPAVLAV